VTRQIQNIHLRRIQWAIFSPSLLSYPFSAQYVRDEQHEHAIILLLEALDAASSEVDRHFQQLGYMPMGKYFEQLLFFILEKDSRYEIILKNYQIKEENLTIGELDLIVKDTQTNKLEHWEICLKYYLQSSQTSTHSAMIGPNAKDNLAKKMKKLQELQMMHSSHPQILSIINFQPIDIKLFIKGQFFYHLNNRMLVANDTNPLHDWGWWCLHSEVEQMLNDNLKWAILDKPDWIGSHQTTAGHTLKTPYQLSTFLADHFSHQHQAVFCVGMKESNGIWQEKSRGFVVNNTWPHPMPLKA